MGRMHLVELPLERLREAIWAPNVMGDEMLQKLRNSVVMFGQVENLVVRPADDGSYEVLSGNHRLRVLRELGKEIAACVVVDVDDARARLLAQALNRIEGEDDLGLKAELVRDVLREVPQADVLALLPDSAESLKALASLGGADLAEHLRAWQQAQAARLRHLTFQLAKSQLEVVEEAMERVMGVVTHDGSNPNRRGNALYILCKTYLELVDGGNP